jgi:hypothetical protein
MLREPAALPVKKEMKQRGRSQTLLIALGLGLFAILIYAKSSFSVAWDLTDYLAIAKNVANGRGYVDAVGLPAYDRIFFTTYLASVIELFGPSLGAIACAVYAVSALLIVTIFLAGNQLYGRAVGIVSALAFLASDSLIFWVPRHIDPVWPIFLIIALILLLQETVRSVTIGSVAAISLFLAVLTKLVAILFVFVPLLLWILGGLPGGRRRALSFTLATMVLLTGWVAMLAFVGGNAAIASALEMSLARAIARGLQSGVINLNGLSASMCESPSYGATLAPDFLKVSLLPLLALRGIAEYIFDDSGLLKNLPAATLMMIATLFVIIRGIILRRRSDLVLLSVFVCFLPLASICGLMHARFSQVLILIIMIYLASASAIDGIVTLGCRVFDHLRLFAYGIAVIGLVGYCLISNFNLRESAALAAIAGHGSISIDLVADRVIPEIDRLMPQGAVIATNDDEILNGVFWRRGATTTLIRLSDDMECAVQILEAQRPQLIIISINVRNGASLLHPVEAMGFSRMAYVDLSSRRTEFYQGR